MKKDINNKVVLCIFDGFGFKISKFYNPTFEAKFFFNLLKSNPHSLLKASGREVGLPEKQVGGSEVGHMTIGAGRVINQALNLINEAIFSGEIENKQDILEFVSQLKANGGVAHIIGLFSSGGIHSHKSHYLWAIRFMKKCGIEVKLHIFLDGRDTYPKDALKTLPLELKNSRLNLDDIGTIQGRKFAMDRDGNFDFTNKSIDAILNANADLKSVDPLKTIKDMYKKRIFDEEFPIVVMDSYKGASANSGFFIINFRSDRIVQTIGRLLEFDKNVLTMTNCGQEIDDKIKIIFRNENVKNSLGEIISDNGIRQLRLAETEKFPHITKFFNGGEERTFSLEDRVLIPTKREDGSGVIISPEMATPEITEELIKKIKSDKYGFICVNYASTDVIGHTGDFYMAETAIRILDNCIEKVYRQCLESNYTLIITSDHGNIETMMDKEMSPVKSHTFSLVPFIVISNDKSLRVVQKIKSLKDVAPTILDIMGVEKPIEMTGESLIYRI